MELAFHKDFFGKIPHIITLHQTFVKIFPHRLFLIIPLIAYPDADITANKPLRMKNT